MKKKLLIFDLDETLIYSTDKPLERKADFQVGSYWSYQRPHLSYLIKAVSPHFELAVWTSSGSDYAKFVVVKLFKDVELSFVWSSVKCTQRFDPVLYKTVQYKDLKKVKRLGYPLSQIIMADDSPEKLRRQYGNLVRVKPYYGQTDDDELRLLAWYLPSLANVENVRMIEKRDWRSKVRSESQ